MLTIILVGSLVGVVCLAIGWWIGYNLMKQQAIIASEERAVKIVEHWIQKLQDQKIRSTIDNSYDAQIIEWTIEQCIEDEDYEEAHRLQQILENLRKGRPPH